MKGVDVRINVGSGILEDRNVSIETRAWCWQFHHQGGNRTTLLFRIVVGCTFLAVSAFWLGPIVAEAWVPPQWIDRVAMEVMVQKNLSKTGNCDPSFKQLELISEAAVKGACIDKRNAINRFLEMLEPKEGGISTERRT